LASGGDSQAEPRKETEIIVLDTGESVEIFYFLENQRSIFGRSANRDESAISPGAGVIVLSSARQEKRLA
jgi:hypothetical protein